MLAIHTCFPGPTSFEYIDFVTGQQNEYPMNKTNVPIKNCGKQILGVVVHHRYFGEHPGVIMSFVTFPVMIFSARKMLQGEFLKSQIKKHQLFLVDTEIQSDQRLLTTEISSISNSKQTKTQSCSETQVASLLAVHSRNDFQQQA